MEPSPNNSRYILELERNELLQEKYQLDRKYGTFSFAFLASLESFALLAYLYIATVLIYSKKNRSKTNLIVAFWALINFMVLLEKLSRVFVMFVGDDSYVISKDSEALCQMIASLGRSYGTSLAIIWLYSKYFGMPKPKFDVIIYFLMCIPSFICFYFIFYYFNVDPFIYEAYGPGSDVIHLSIYLLIGFVFIMCKIFVTDVMETSQYALLISLVNLITNLPISLITIYLRFNLDISWVYRFQIYFVDLFLNVISCSNAFIVLFIIILYHENIKEFLVRRKIRRQTVKHEYC